MDLRAMLTNVTDGLMGVVNTLMADYTMLGLAVAVIILAALFMSSLEQLVSTTMTALLGYVVLGAALVAYNADWAYEGAVGGVWDGFAGDGGLTFFAFFMYFIVFGVAIAIVNIVKGMVAG